jgi:transcriptional regulator with XRE-family HTH domain
MFGEVLREARIEAAMTQEQLAFEAELDRTFISRLEHNHTSPTLETLFRLADALNMTAAALVARVEQTRRRAKR